MRQRIALFGGPADGNFTLVDIPTTNRWEVLVHVPARYDSWLDTNPAVPEERHVYRVRLNVDTGHWTGHWYGLAPPRVPEEYRRRTPGGLRR